MACACKGSQNVEYQLVYKGDEPTETVATLAEARVKLRSSSKGGNMKVVAKK